MHKFIRMWALVAVLLGTAAAASAATPSEFYLGLLRRGTASYDAGRYTDAVKQLRIAAFGLVEAVDQYQCAQVYLTLTYDKLSDPDRAREAAHRVVVAERVERKYASLPLAPAVRTSFETVAGRLLSATESAMLLRPAETSTPPPSSTKQRAANTPQMSASTPRRTTTAPQSVTATPPSDNPKAAATTPQKAKPQTTVAATQTVKPSTTTASTSSTTKSAQPDGRGGPIEPPRPAATSTPAARTLAAGEVATRLSTADRSLNTGNLAEARRVYRELLGAPGLDHETFIRIAEGLYRARDFSGAISAFNRAGTLRAGEEPYRYYIAVALYETGDFARAKKELVAALPYIEVTPDVARYRTKIEGSR